MIFNPRCTCCCQSPVIFQAHYKLVKRSLINVSHYRAILFMIMHICARHCLRLGTIYENRRTAVTFLFRPFFSNPKKTNDRIPCLWIFHRTIILKQHKSCRGKKKAGKNARGSSRMRNVLFTIQVHFYAGINIPTDNFAYAKSQLRFLRAYVRGMFNSCVVLGTMVQFEIESLKRRKDI